MKRRTFITLLGGAAAAPAMAGNYPCRSVQQISGDILPPPSPPTEKATYLDFIRSRHTLQNALALSSYGPTSNAQHDQRYKSDADERRYERDGVVFEPMPITGKHDVLSLFYENRSAVAHPKLRRMGLLLTRLLSKNQALILELRDWKKF